MMFQETKKFTPIEERQLKVNTMVQCKNYVTSEQQRLDQTEIIFTLRRNGGYIHSSLGGRYDIVVRQAGRQTKMSLL